MLLNNNGGKCVNYLWQEITWCVNTYSNVSGDADDVTLAQFGTAVGQLKFRGTSRLLRLPASPVGKIHQQGDKNSPQVTEAQDVLEANPSKKQKQDKELQYEDDDMDVTTSQTGTADVGGADSEPDFGSDSNHGYSIATHFVKVQSSGTLADVKSLWQLAGTDAVSQSVKTLLEHTRPGMQRFSSIHAFEKVIPLCCIIFSKFKLHNFIVLFIHKN